MTDGALVARLQISFVSVNQLFASTVRNITRICMNLTKMGHNIWVITHCLGSAYKFANSGVEISQGGMTKFFFLWGEGVVGGVIRVFFWKLILGDGTSGNYVDRGRWVVGSMTNIWGPLKRKLNSLNFNENPETEKIQKISSFWLRPPLGAYISLLNKLN